MLQVYITTINYIFYILRIFNLVGWLPGNRQLAMATEALKTNDLFQTSSGVGHHWRPGYYFPSSRHQVRVRHRALYASACKIVCRKNTGSQYTSWTNRQSYNYWSIQKCHYYCLKLDSGYSTVLYSVWSCAPTQRSRTVTDFILHLHLHCRSIKFAPVSVWFPVSRLSQQLFCLPSLMLRSLHLIEVESIIAKKKQTLGVQLDVDIEDVLAQAERLFASFSNYY